MSRIKDEIKISHYATDNSKQCAYCSKIIEDDNYLHCQECRRYVHIKCLRHASTPGDLLGDVFFDFVCAKCMQLQFDGPSTSTGAAKEKFIRQRMPWILVITLALYNLSIKSKGLSHHGYFHWRTHIVSFIDKNWDFLFEPTVKKRKKWIGSVTGNISHNSPEFFLSGQEEFNEPGWWKLTHANQTPRHIFKLYEQFCQNRQQMRIDKRPADEKSSMLTDTRNANDSKRIRTRNDSEEQSFTVNSCSRTIPYMGRKPKLAKQLNIVDVDTSKSIQPVQEPLSTVQSSLMDFLAESLASDDLTLFNNLPNIASEPLVGSGGKNDYLISSLIEAHNENPSLFDLAGIKNEPTATTSYGMPPEVTSKLKALYKQNAHDEKNENLPVKLDQTDQYQQQKTFQGKSKHANYRPVEAEDDNKNDNYTDINDDVINAVDDDDNDGDNDEDDEFKPRIVQITNFQQQDEKTDPSTFPTGIDIKKELTSDSEHTENEALKGKRNDSEPLVERKAPKLPPCKPSLFTRSTKRNWPWLIQKDSEETYDATATNLLTNESLVMMSEYEERILLRKMHKIFALENKCNLEIPSYVRRFYRKLCVRDWKREHSRPLFNLDDYLLDQNIKRAVENTPNIIDRYQLISLTTKDARKPFYARIAGSCQYELFQSPYTKRILHPFIYRNKECTPPWLKLLCEIQYAVKGEIPTRAPIDYCYIRPNHVAAVNALLQTAFWPGIDMSDCLSYPDFSVVALYKKLVIGCGFLVPDVGFNEAYISFMAVRPAWQRSGIATFMLYHLIQTCMSKDITLHVSATNPAVVLYQKFGFKIEEVILDFYEKYLPLDATHSRNAFFLRLMR